MRSIKCHQASGITVQEVLDEFNERATEFGIKGEGDIISVSAMPPMPGTKLATSTGTADAKVHVVVFYWSNE